MDPSPQTDSLDMRALASLLYRDNVRQKHSAKPRVKESMKQNAAEPRGRAYDAYPITAEHLAQMIGNHLIEAPKAQIDQRSFCFLFMSNF